MDFDDIPDDVWITILEYVADSSVLAILVRTCQRFHLLASKPLLRKLKWMKPESTQRNLEAWKDIYRNVVSLPYKVTIGVPFDLAVAMRRPEFPLTPVMQLHDLVHQQLLRFTSLVELSLVGTTFSPYTYVVLGSIPTLRRLHVENCTFILLHSSFRERLEAHTRANPSFTHLLAPSQDVVVKGLPLFHTMRITHLSLHRHTVPSELETSPFHPFCLLDIPTLTSLSITWTANIAARYSHDEWPLASITELKVIIPLLSRDLLFMLSAFVNECVLRPKFELKIEKHNLSDSQMATVRVPSKGLWNYEGPLSIVATSMKRSVSPVLTRVKINETLDLSPLIKGLEKLPSSIEDLHIQLNEWDMEILFAVKELFKNMKKLLVRYARGSFPPDLLVRIGADILFCMPELHSITLLGPKTREDGNSDNFLFAGRPHGKIDSSHSGHGNASRQPYSQGVQQVVPTSRHSEPQNALPRRGHPVPIVRLPRRHPESVVSIDLDDEDEGKLNEEHGLNPATGFACTHSSTSLNRNLNQNRSTPPLFHDRIGPVITTQQSSFPFAGVSSSMTASTSNLTSVSCSNVSLGPKSRGGSCMPESKQPFGLRERAEDLEPRIVQSALTISQADLRDYLIGWSRYCPSLRIVRIDHRWWWERKFVDDRWVLKVSGKEESVEKGKERDEE